LLPLSQNTQLFSILGTAYGGNGTTTFALPNLPGIPVGTGQGPGLSDYDIGEEGGEATVALGESQLARHSHGFNALTDQAKAASPDNNALARAFEAQANTDNVVNFYSPHPELASTALAASAVAASGGGGAHNNMQPYLALSYCIAMQGIYPQRGGNAPVPWTPFIGEIAIFAFGMAPPDWLACNGQLLPLNQNQALFSLLGTTFGGDGMRTFALPDLRGRVPLGFAPDHPFGQIGGQAAHVLTVNEMPAHSHALKTDAVTQSGLGSTPSSATVLGRSSGAVVPGNTPFSADLYNTGAPKGALNAQTIASAGGGQAHDNMMPSLALNFCINANPQGLYPSR
jgi:microcystin-dependent protein